MFTKEKVSVTRVNRQSRDGMAQMGFTVEASGLEGVLEARRVG